MHAVTAIGLEIAKSVFQIHGVDAAGNIIVRRQRVRYRPRAALIHCSGLDDARTPPLVLLVAVPSCALSAAR